MWRLVIGDRAKARGQAVVEFALVLPIFLMLTVGVIDLGRGVYFYNTLASVAREGARFGIVLTDPANGSWADLGNLHYTMVGGSRVVNTNKVYNPPEVVDLADTSTIVGRIAAKAGILDLRQLKVTISATGLQPREQLTVEVEHPFRPLVSYILGDVTIAMKASSTMGIQ